MTHVPLSAQRSRFSSNATARALLFVKLKVVKSIYRKQMRPRRRNAKGMVSRSRQSPLKAEGSAQASNSAGAGRPPPRPWSPTSAGEGDGQCAHYHSPGVSGRSPSSTVDHRGYQPRRIQAPKPGCGYGHPECPCRPRSTAWSALRKPMRHRLTAPAYENARRPLRRVCAEKHCWSPATATKAERIADEMCLEAKVE